VDVHAHAYLEVVAVAKSKAEHPWLYMTVDVYTALVLVLLER